MPDPIQLDYSTGQRTWLQRQRWRIWTIFVLAVAGVLTWHYFGTFIAQRVRAVMAWHSCMSAVPPKDGIVYEDRAYWAKEPKGLSRSWIVPQWWQLGFDTPSDFGNALVGQIFLGSMVDKSGNAHLVSVRLGRSFLDHDRSALYLNVHVVDQHSFGLKHTLVDSYREPVDLLPPYSREDQWIRVFAGVVDETDTSRILIRAQNGQTPEVTIMVSLDVNAQISVEPAAKP